MSQIYSLLNKIISIYFSQSIIKLICFVKYKILLIVIYEMLISMFKKIVVVKETITLQAIFVLLIKDATLMVVTVIALYDWFIIFDYLHYLQLI